MTSKPGLKFSVAAIDSAKEILKTMPPAPRETKEVGLREAIEALAPTIRTLLGKGYSRQQVVDLLQEQGVGCSLMTLKTYFRQKPTKSKAKAPAVPATATKAAGRETGSSTTPLDIGGASNGSPGRVGATTAVVPHAAVARVAGGEPAQSVTAAGAAVRTAAKVS